MPPGSHVSRVADDTCNIQQIRPNHVVATISHVDGFDGVRIRLPDGESFCLDVHYTDLVAIDAEITHRLNGPYMVPISMNPRYTIGYDQTLSEQHPIDTARTAQYSSMIRGVMESGFFRNLNMQWAAPERTTPSSPPESRQTRRGSTIRRTPHRNYLTLMPHSSYKETAACLADSDLKLMRVVVLRVLRALEGGSAYNNAAVQLWVNHKQSLVRYGIAIAIELRSRGFKDTSLEKLRDHYEPGDHVKPHWVAWERLRDSHRAYLTLRDERRIATQRINHAGWASRIEFCARVGMQAKRCWILEDIQEIRHSTPNSPSRPNFYTQHWVITPAEHFIYPEEATC